VKWPALFSLYRVGLCPTFLFGEVELDIRLDFVLRMINQIFTSI
jgi:hypothetical protein